MKISLNKVYTKRRLDAYPPIGEQLDLLYHSIEAGEFGESAKSSQFFKELRKVKEDIPKE
jgi:hypothetical protein